MSDLRTQLESAKREYESIRYPGDLAIELGVRRVYPRLRLALITTGLVAVAAAAAMVLMIQPEASIAPPQVAVAPIAPEEPTDVVSLLAVPTVDSFPDDLDLAPEGAMSFPEMPEFPSYSPASELVIPSTEESV